MPTIFLNYRRSDAGGYAGRLADALEKRFGAKSVFQDVEAIEPGSNFVDAIDTAIARCEAVVVLIGNTWLTERDPDGRVRLDDPRDFVRLEIASALRAGKPVLPVLVEGVRMPAEGALPVNLRALTKLQALELSDTRWDYDVTRVAEAIEALTGSGTSARRRRWAAAIAATMLVAGIAGALGYVALKEPVDISGQWDLPGGSFWTVVQDDHRLLIEETHVDSKQVWKRGTGTLKRDRVEFALDGVFGAPHHYEGVLTISRGGNTMIGIVRDTSRSGKEPLTLTRRR